MAMLLSSKVSTSQLIKILIKKQRQRGLGTSAGCSRMLANRVSGRQETAVSEAAA